MESLTESQAALGSPVQLDRLNGNDPMGVRLSMWFSQEGTTALRPMYFLVSVGFAGASALTLTTAINRTPGR